MCRTQLVLGFFGGYRARFQQQDASDNLQAVCNAVPHLAQQGSLLLKQLLCMLQKLLLLLFSDPAFGDVLDRD